MATIQATTREVHISPRKLRVLSDVVKNHPAQDALSRLSLLPKKGGLVISKLIKNALNTANTKNLASDSLKVVAFQVNEGPRMKRWLPAPRGRSYRITKKTSHITITLSDSKDK